MYIAPMTAEYEEVLCILHERGLPEVPKEGDDVASEMGWRTGDPVSFGPLFYVGAIVFCFYIISKYIRREFSSTHRSHEGLRCYCYCSAADLYTLVRALIVH